MMTSVGKQICENRLARTVGIKMEDGISFNLLMLQLTEEESD